MISAICIFIIANSGHFEIIFVDYRGIFFAFYLFILAFWKESADFHSRIALEVTLRF